MTKRILFLIVLLAVLCPKSPIFAEELSDSRTLRETIAFGGAGTQRLIVDNIWGSVVVRGHSGESIEMVAEETVRAKNTERIEQATRRLARIGRDSPKLHHQLALLAQRFTAMPKLRQVAP